MQFSDMNTYLQAYHDFFKQIVQEGCAYHAEVLNESLVIFNLCQACLILNQKIENKFMNAVKKLLSTNVLQLY